MSYVQTHTSKMNPKSKESLAKRLGIDPDQLEENPVKINPLEGCPPGFPDNLYIPHGMNLSEMLFMKGQITPWTTSLMNQLINYDVGAVTLFLWDWTLIHKYELGLNSTEGEFRQIVIPKGIGHCFISKSSARLLLTTFEPY